MGVSLCLGKCDCLNWQQDTTLACFLDDFPSGRKCIKSASEWVEDSCMWFYVKIGPYKENCDLKSDALKGQSNNVHQRGERKCTLFPFYEIKYDDYLLINQTICKYKAIL